MNPRTIAIGDIQGCLAAGRRHSGVYTFCCRCTDYRSEIDHHPRRDRRTLARYPAALSVSTLHASSSRRDKGQLNETVRGVFGSGHLGGGRAAWGLVTLGICIPIQPMTPAWARSETAQRQAATRSVGRESLVGVTGVGLDPIMTPRQHRLDAPKDPRGASATGPGCRGWSWNSEIRGGRIGLRNCPERECVGVVLMSVGSLARSFAAGPRHNSGSDPRG